MPSYLTACLRIQVAACELLHSLVLYSIGRGAAQPGTAVTRASMGPLFKHLFPAMLKLSCDVELVRFCFPYFKKLYKQ